MGLPIDTTSYPSPNFSERPDGVVPDLLVLHTGEGTKDSDLATLRSTRTPPDKRVSAHYYVDRAGRVYQLVDPRLEAWHAGASTWAGRKSLNSYSIGVETEHKIGQNWPDVQRQALAVLFGMLIDRYHIPQGNVVAHRWIAPRRKQDPTDWPNDQLVRWIAALYDRRYRFRVTQAALSSNDLRAALLAPTVDAPHIYQAGDVITVDDITAGVAHDASGLGFVPLAVVEKL